MLKWAAIFAVLALVTALLGFGGLASGLAGIAKLLYFGFEVSIVSLRIAGVGTGRRLAGSDTDRVLP